MAVSEHTVGHVEALDHLLKVLVIDHVIGRDEDSFAWAWRKLPFDSRRHLEEISLGRVALANCLSIQLLIKSLLLRCSHFDSIASLLDLLESLCKLSLSCLLCLGKEASMVTSWSTSRVALIWATLWPRPYTGWHHIWTLIESVEKPVLHKRTLLSSEALFVPLFFNLHRFVPAIVHSLRSGIRSEPLSKCVWS